MHSFAAILQDHINNSLYLTEHLAHNFYMIVISFINSSFIHVYSYSCSFIHSYCYSFVLCLFIYMDYIFMCLTMDWLPESIISNLWNSYSTRNITQYTLLYVRNDEEKCEIIIIKAMWWWPKTGTTENKRELRHSPMCMSALKRDYSTHYLVGGVTKTISLWR